MCRYFVDRSKKSGKATTTLRQALTNLLDNAIRYTPAHGHIKVRVGHSNKDGRCIVEVEDDGPGIAPEEQDRIFDRFYYAKNDSDPKAQGTGLGLAIARNAVEANRGRLVLRNALEGGSVFSMSFPA